jgi:RNA polymerase sigma factor (TIGR02999 family)
MLVPMANVTRILEAVAAGDPPAADELLPVVYVELRKLAAARMAAERADHTLDATALVHEAYLRLVASPGRQSGEAQFDNRGHFFAACAEAMRRILVEHARRKAAGKRGGGNRRVALEAADLGRLSPDEDVLAIDDALTRLASEDATAARLIQLRYFAGLSVEDAADAVGISRSTAYEHWAYAKVRLRCLLDGM